MTMAVFLGSPVETRTYGICASATAGSAVMHSARAIAGRNGQNDSGGLDHGLSSERRGNQRRQHAA